MRKIQITTPQNVNLSFNPAGIGHRILAFIIDFIVIGVYIYLVYKLFDILFVGSFRNFFEDDSINFVTILFSLAQLPVITYSLWTEYLFRGQTLGKMVMNIKVVKLKGYTAGFNEFFIRWVLRMIDIWTFFFVAILLFTVIESDAAWGLMVLIFFMSGLVAVISIASSNKNQRIGDRFAGTTVIKLKEKHDISITILEEIEKLYQPTYSQVLKLSDNDARIIKDTFRLAKKSKDHVTISRLKRKLEEVMEVEAKENAEDFIETVMKDFNYYTQKM